MPQAPFGNLVWRLCVSVRAVRLALETQPENCGVDRADYGKVTFDDEEGGF